MKLGSVIEYCGKDVCRETISRLARERAALLAAAKRVMDSPFEPDKWRLNVEQAIQEAEKS